ncbi:PfkB family carbohydrate kinase [Fusibacter bizertensis]
MTNREQEILEILKQNPLISQNELADQLGITRSSAAVHITNLMKKGHIMGKGYIVRDGAYVCVIGGSNIDIQGVPNNTLIFHDSNIGVVKSTLGGVGRNIAENMVKLGLKTKLISVIGDDLYGQKILEEARQIGLDMQDTLVLKGEQTSTYLSILDETKDMAVAISHMEICDRMTVEFIKSKKHIIENAEFCVIDTNLSPDVLKYILTTYKEQKFLLDTVSTAKAMKIKEVIGLCHTIKPNLIEAQSLSGIEIKDEKDMLRAATYFHGLGVSNVFISMGKAGVFYSDGKVSGMKKPPKVKVVSATGAGDAFLAGIALGYAQGEDIKTATLMGMAASFIALEHEDTINPYMSEELLLEKLKEINHVK